MKNSIIACAIALIAGGLLGRYLTPPKEVTKVQTVEKEVIRRDIKIITVKNPDGTTTTTTIDNSVETKDKKKDTLISKNTEKQWFATGGYGRNGIMGDTIYTASVSRRVIGPYFLGSTGTFTPTKNDYTIGIHIGVEF